MVSEAGSAAVTCFPYDEDYSLLYDSSQVVEVLDTSFLLIYEVATIDSLGRYFTIFNDDYFVFERVNDSLITIAITDTFPFHDPEFRVSGAFVLDISFEQEIKNVTVNNKRFKWDKKRNRVWIRISRRKMLKNREELFFEVELKPKHFQMSTSKKIDAED